MNQIVSKHCAKNGLSPQLEEARIAASLAPERYLLSNGRVSRRAVSCVVRPEVGDLVLAAASDGECYVLHILAREAGGCAALSVSGADELRFEASRLTLLARKMIAMKSLQDIELAAAGTFSQSSVNQFVHVAEALVESLNQHFSRSSICTQEASELMSVHGAEVLLSALRDLRADAERISLG